MLLALCQSSAYPYKPLTVEDIYSTPAFRGVPFQNPRWSPDGRELIFQTTDPETKHRVYLAADPVSGRTRLLLDPETVKARFSSLAALTQKSGEPARRSRRISNSARTSARCCSCTRATSTSTNCSTAR